MQRSCDGKSLGVLEEQEGQQNSQCGFGVECVTVGLWEIRSERWAGQEAEHKAPCWLGHEVGGKKAIPTSLQRIYK